MKNAGAGASAGRVGASPGDRADLEMVEHRTEDQAVNGRVPQH